MDNISRRTAVKAIGIGAVAMSAVESTGQLSPQITPPVFGTPHQPRPLKFDPSKLTGLSERLVKSHWENNYIGSVKTLNAVRSRLAVALADSDMPPVIYGGLKREELHRTGSVVLHEIYFEGLGGNGQAGGRVKDAISAAWGSFDTWAAEFRRTGMSLAGGSGWALLSYNLHTRQLHNQWAWDHMNGAAAGIPILALDMYEHSFHMDYGTQAAKYIDAFFQNVDWEAIDARYENVTKVAA